MSNLSVNVCTHCRTRNLTYDAVKAGYYKCPDCIYFETKGIYNVEQYNKWLKQ